MFGYSHKQANDLIANKTGMEGSKAFPLSILVTFLPKEVLITLQKYASISDLNSGNLSRVGHLATPPHHHGCSPPLPVWTCYQLLVVDLDLIITPYLIHQMGVSSSLFCISNASLFMTFYEIQLAYIKHHTVDHSQFQQLVSDCSFSGTSHLLFKTICIQIQQRMR